MKRNYFFQFLKKSLCLVSVFVMLLTEKSNSQTTATVGTGTLNTYNFPVNSLYGFSYTQQIYTASLISAAGGTPTAGAIRKIRFSMASGGFSFGNDNCTFYMGHTTKTSFTSTTDWIPVSGLTTVFSGTVTYPSSPGWVEITLTTPFIWDGTSNIVIAADENASSYTCCNYFNYTSSGTDFRALHYRNDFTNPNPSSPPTASGRSSFFPNAQFVFQNECSGTPTAGSTAASATSICLGSAVNLSLPTASTSAGITYQWQSSPDNIAPYTDISGATGLTYNAFPLSSTYYRCKVSCTASGISTFSSPQQIIFTNNIAGITSNVRCGTGTVSLAATGSAGATLKWYTTATGGTSIGSGSPFTTPTIATTTNYYVAAETSLVV
jgi:hypothetical protein